MAPITIGLAIGIPVVIAVGHTVASQLYGVESYDPLILGVAIAVLVISAAFAAVVPAPPRLIQSARSAPSSAVQ